MCCALTCFASRPSGRGAPKEQLGRSDGGATGSSIGCSGSSSGASSSAPRRSTPSSRRSGRARGFAVIQGYGLTETAPIVSVTHPFHIQAGSVGKAIAGVDVKIAPDGEILVRGENVTGGYFEAEAETAKAFEGGWFHTGDIGEIGPDGRLFIRGRKKEVIVTPEGLEGLPGGCRAGREPDPRRARLRRRRRRERAGGGRRARARRARARPGVDPDAVVREANAAPRKPPEDSARARVAAGRAAAHRGDREAETRGDP